MAIYAMTITSQPSSVYPDRSFNVYVSELTLTTGMNMHANNSNINIRNIPDHPSFVLKCTVTFTKTANNAGYFTITPNTSYNTVGGIYSGSLNLYTSTGGTNSKTYSTLINDIRIVSIPAPSAPSTLSYSTSATTNTSISVSWSSVSGATSYVLERRTGSGSYTQVYSGSSTSYSQGKLSAGTYTYRIKAVNSAGSSSYKTGSILTVTIPNSAPTTPSSLTYTQSTTTTGTISVSWGTSTDSDGNLSGYILERQIGTASYTQVYKGSNTSWSMSSPSVGSYSFRVKAYDSAGAESSYRTVTYKCTVTQANRAPYVSPSSKSLGIFSTTKPSVSYTVYDADDDSITVKEYMNSTLMYTLTKSNGGGSTISPNNWTQVLNGSHTLKVTVSDGSASGYVNYTFTKKVTKIKWLQKNIMEPVSEERPSKIQILVTHGNLNLGTLKIYVTNNAYDTNPIWEDMTTEALENKRYTFINTEKTSDKWGVRLKFEFDKGSNTSTCYIKSITGGFI